MQKTYQAAIYLRLSREDGDVTEGSKQVSNVDCQVKLTHFFI